MELITRQELMRLPEGTIYSGYTPHVSNGLFQKGATIRSQDGLPIDWYSTSLLPEFSHELLGTGKIPMTTNTPESRDGMFGEGDRFLVYEYDDLQRLQSAITGAIDSLPIRPGYFVIQREDGTYCRAPFPTQEIAVASSPAIKAK